MITHFSLIFDNIFMLILASFFLFFGLAIFLYDQYYRRNAKTVPGKISGIESYVSRTRTSNSKSSNLMYRPVISFIHNSTQLFFKASISKNTISDKIGDQVEVQIIHNTPHSARIGGRNSLRNFSYAFLIIAGIIMAVIFHQTPMPLEYKVLRVLFPFLLNFIAYKFIMTKIKKHGGLKNLMLKNNNLTTKVELMKLDIFWQNYEIEKEEEKVHRPFLIINPVLMALSAWPAIVFGDRLFKQEFVVGNLNKAFFSFDAMKDFVNTIMANHSMKEEFLILAISSFFFLCFSYSLVFCIKKTRPRSL
jgi:hypothetical protein